MTTTIYEEINNKYNNDLQTAIWPRDGTQADTITPN